MIRALLVDDSAVIRKVFSRVLGAQRDIEIIGEAPDPYVAREIIVQKKPDVIVLDIEMPRMDGLTFLRRLMKHHPVPVIVCSTLTVRGGEVAMEAMDAGAVGVVCKPTETHSLTEVGPELIAAVRSAAGARPKARGAQQHQETMRGSGRSMLAIGASTGGTVAIETILRSLPENAPPTVIVQHMPAYMTPLFADRLNKVSRMKAREARDGDLLEIGVALVAPGGKHVLVEPGPGGLRVRVKEGPLVNGHRPSADVLFASVARAMGKSAIGVLLTGMGKDGAKGLLQMRGAGSRTLAQDEASSVVYGMPKAAVDIDAAQEVVSLGAIPARLVRLAESLAA